MSSDKTFSLFASVPKGLEPLLARELRELGGLKVSAVQAGASFRGTLETAYRVCLWSRTANRVLLSQKRFRAASPEELYTGIQTIRWSDHLAPEGTLAVSFYTSNSAITHSQYGAQRVKDAIVDQFREEFGIRPSVDLARPHLRINVYLMKNEARVSLDLSGESLHRRGYRREGGKAPLKENLAAAILILGGWPELSSSGRPLLDLMCGSGTLPIEAALMAGDIAPGLSRGYFGFLNWKWHDSGVWERLLNEARERRRRGLERLPSIVGYDLDDGMVRVARDNIQSAGLSEYIQIENRDLGAAGTESGATGLVVVNPPYGERLGEEQRLVRLYTRLGKVLRDRFAGWRAAVFTGNPELGRRMTLGSGPATTLYNGALECRLFDFQIPAKQSPESPNHGVKSVPEPGEQPLSDGSSMLINRLRKNLKHTGRWARRNGISCYRLYDSDLPEYPMAVDVYSGTKTWVHVQEYAAPRSVDESRVEQRSREALVAIKQVLEVPGEQLFHKIRRKQKGRDQYEKLGKEGIFHEVREGECRLLVNFTDYLDTGLFPDHRITRKLIGELVKGKNFLNLFGYTGAATVHAAMGGAKSTTTVDLSPTYLDWAGRNLKLNGIGGARHRLIQEECVAWLEEQPWSGDPHRYGLIFLDPPTFSNSKKMDHDFDVQRDYVTLITQVSRLLDKDGLLIFSTNSRRFKLDGDELSGLAIRNITRETIPQDFKRRPKIHQCWQISKK